MQCKNIPDRPILEFLAAIPNNEWAFNFPLDISPNRSVLAAMPESVPHKLAVVKMARLIDRGLVSGCGCGCRGDYVITQAGREYLAQEIK